MPFFIGMSDENVNAIIKRLVMRHALEGDVIVRENEYGYVTPPSTPRARTRTRARSRHLFCVLLLVCGGCMHCHGCGVTSHPTRLCGVFVLVCISCFCVAVGYPTASRCLC